jgi:hypothetical protein
MLQRGLDSGRNRVSGLGAADHVDDFHLLVLGPMTMSVGTENAVRPSLLDSPPLGVSAELAGAAGRALQYLPDELLRAMVLGLQAHADELAPGVLFRGSTSGGCAVGITLRELAPDAFAFGWLRFWLWQRWRRGVERDVARRYPRLKHLQWNFDAAVAELERAGDPQPAKTVGLWLAASAQAELRARRSAIAERKSLRTRPARRAHHWAETNRIPPGPELCRWS